MYPKFSLRTCSLAIALACFSYVPSANADVYGRLRIAVNCEQDQKPVTDARVLLHDETKAHADVRLITDDKGLATSPLLENRVWTVIVKAESFKDISQQARVVSDTVTDLILQMEPTKLTTITVRGKSTLLRPTETSASTYRSEKFTEKFPVSVSNPQQLTGLLVSTPGFVQDSANQVHPRGEHSASSIYIQGFQLGGAAQGRFGPIIDPRALENLDIMTGAFAPEYAGDSAILNTAIRSGTAKPFTSGEIGGGNYGTGDADVSVGGQAGQTVGAADNEGYESKIFSYFLNASGHTTDNALESPQPRNQSAHNSGESGSFLGRFDLDPTMDDTFSLILNTSPARTDVANRTGLPDRYAPYGQGYGFGGALSADDAGSQGIFSQDKLGQDIYQRDENSFGLSQWRHDFNEKLSSVMSFGLDQSKLDTLNDNPNIDFDDLPGDNSIEYNPTVKRESQHKQFSGSLAYASGPHSFKIGGQYSDERADDSYNLLPASQLAVDALYAADPRLLPYGKPAVDANGEPVLDAQGHQVYGITKGATSPTLDVASRGFYYAGYAEDTWRLLDTVTANYGVRYDRYHQFQNLGDDDVDADQFSPRANVSWGFYPSWVARASYDRLFIEPPISQGSFIGSSIEPEKVNQYEGSIEKELTPRQSAKVSYYYKDISDQVDTGLLIPSTQLGLFTSVNLDKDAVHGLEFSYDVAPDHGFGWSGYTSYAYSVAKPSGFDNTGEPVEKYNDHDQRHTLSTGAAYTFDGNYSTGANYYYGSGLASSVLSEDGPRHSNDRLDLNGMTPPDLLFGKAGLKLTLGNVFDKRDVINFNSDFSGTRFEQGRTVYLAVYFNF